MSERMPAGAGVGRVVVRRPEPELLIEQFVTGTTDAAALLITGEAGIGKSTLWGLGLSAAAAAGQVVLSTRAAESEVGLSFSGLGDLLGRVGDDVLAGLPTVQREALDAALLRGTAAAVPQAIGAAVFGILRSLAAENSVLVAIDDLQWLDSASTDALAFALRRLPDEAVQLLVSIRTSSALVPVAESAHDPVQAVSTAVLAGAVETLILQPFAAAELGELISDRLGLELPQEALDELRDRTDGNPFWALEVARGLTTAVPSTLRIPESLPVSVQRRLFALPASVREVLVTVSGLSHPSVGLARRALAPVLDDSAAAIDAAVDLGVLELTDGRLHPAHPLLASVALEGLPPGRRAELHRRLASAVDDPEQRARHLVLAAHGEPSAELAIELDLGVAAAHHRGAIRAAGDLAALAVELTPAGLADERAARALTAAELWFGVGDAQRARAFAEQGACSSQRSVKVAALCMLGAITYWVEGAGPARADLFRALRAAGQDPVERARTLQSLADMGDQGASVDGAYAREALELLDGLRTAAADEVRAAALLSTVKAQLDLAQGLDENAVAAAAECEARLPSPPTLLLQRVAVQTSFRYKVVDQLDRSRTAIGEAIKIARDEGEDSVLSNLLGHLAMSECWAGRYDAARLAAQEGLDHAARNDWNPISVYGAAGLLHVLTGELDAGRQVVRVGLGYGEAFGHHRAVIVRLHVLGLADLLDGQSESAAEQLGRALAVARHNEVFEPGYRSRLEADLGQAWVSVGRLDEAAELAAEQVALGRLAGRPGVLAVGLRIEGLVRAARGDLNGALTALEESLAAAVASPFPLEEGRTLLALGQVQRRRRAKWPARASLTAARDCFARLGTPPWLAIAEDELRRTEGRHAGRALTDAERRVAALVAAGRSNREAAAELFTSVRTVEGHLASTYRKLGIRGRIELARNLDAS